MAEEDQAKEPPTVDVTFTEPTIIVKGGPEKKVYHLHKSLLTHYSGYFRGALGSPAFQEAQDGIVTLSDVKPRAFEGFVKFLYAKASSRDPDWLKVWEELRIPGSDNADYYELTLAWYYVFADQFIVLDMKRAALSYNLERNSTFNRAPSYKAITFAFDNLPAGDPYLQLLVDRHCTSWGVVLDKSESQADIDALPREFLYMVMSRMAETPQEKRQYFIRPANFYEDSLTDGQAKSSEKR